MMHDKLIAKFTIIMTSCSVTAREIAMGFALQWNTGIMRKNRIMEQTKILEVKWSVGYLYIQHILDKVHELIIVRRGEKIVIYDSFINHRNLSNRSFLVQEFHQLFHELFNVQGSLKNKKQAYNKLFDPPPDFLEDWDGQVYRLWLSPLA
jgi:hypothetical protein